jgi:hypothetical protein
MASPTVLLFNVRLCRPIVASKTPLRAQIAYVGHFALIGIAFNVNIRWFRSGMEPLEHANMPAHAASVSPEAVLTDHA